MRQCLTENSLITCPLLTTVSYCSLNAGAVSVCVFFNQNLTNTKEYQNPTE